MTKNENISTQERYQLEMQHAWFKARQRIVNRMLACYCADARSLLEIGVGTGVMLSAISKEFADLALYAADRTRENLAFISEHLPQCQTIQLDGSQLPFAKAFDVVAAFDVLEHLDDDVGTMKQMHQALRSNGYALITVPQHPFLWSAYDEYDGGWGGHKRRYTRAELCHKMQLSGFTIVKVTSFVSLLLPALMLTRLAPSKKEINALSGLSPRPFINKTMHYLLTLEYALIKRGVDFPCGGSLVMVARKT